MLLQGAGKGALHGSTMLLGRVFVSDDVSSSQMCHFFTHASPLMGVCLPLPYPPFTYGGVHPRVWVVWVCVWGFWCPLGLIWTRGPRSFGGLHGSVSGGSLRRPSLETAFYKDERPGSGEG